MNFDFAQTSLAAVTRQRNLALGSCLGLVLANVALSFGLLNQEEKWILMPQFDNEHKLEVEGGKYSDQYLIDWATGILNTVLCANADSIDWKVHQILKISRSNYGPLKARLQEEKEKIVRNKISTAFYPATFEVRQESKTIDISGEHAAWFGKDSVPIITKKKYRLSWAVRSHGVLLLENLEDINEENKTDEKP